MMDQMIYLAAEKRYCGPFPFPWFYAWEAGL